MMMTMMVTRTTRMRVNSRGGSHFFFHRRLFFAFSAFVMPALGRIPPAQGIAAMQSMQRTLGHLLHHCHGDERPDCPILDDLSGRPAGA